MKNIIKKTFTFFWLFLLIFLINHHFTYEEFCKNDVEIKTNNLNMHQVFDLALCNSNQNINKQATELFFIALKLNLIFSIAGVLVIFSDFFKPSLKNSIIEILILCFYLFNGLIFLIIFFPKILLIGD